MLSSRNSKNAVDVPVVIGVVISFYSFLVVSHGRTFDSCTCIFLGNETTLMVEPVAEKRVPTRRVLLGTMCLRINWKLNLIY